MPALAWQVLAFGATGVSLAVIALRTLAIARLPVHLRWELAPVPQDEGKGSCGGSYLERYEWWRKPRRHSRTSALIYTGNEMLLLRSLCKHNRGLWLLSIALHYGVYLIAASALGVAVVAVLLVAGTDLLATQPLNGCISALALVGYVLGSVGSIGLLLKRTLDPHLRPFNSVSRYLNLLFLAAVFLSGGYAWVRAGDYAAEVIRFVRDWITLDPNLMVAFPLWPHLVISLLFLLYLPVTDMIHFIAKYFTYHAVRWDNRPQNESMREELRGLLKQPVTWSASHVGADGRKNWVDIANEMPSDETTS